MNKFVVDAWAWIEYLRGSPSGLKIKQEIIDDSELSTSIVTLSEVVSKYRRNGQDDEVAISAITSLSRIFVPDQADAIHAGRIHSELKKNSPNFSLADALVLQAARKLKATVLTGDPDFERIEDSVVLH
jgi:predicted nucleic acid-binding protein